LKLVLALVVALAALLPCAAFAAPSLSLHANRVNFYSDSLSVLGDGNVSLRDTNGDRYTAQTITVDLNHDRYLLVGDVTAVLHGKTVRATALNLERSEGHIYAIVVDDGVPRTIRIDRDDIANATTLVAPPGTFDFPNLFNREPYIHGKVAQIVPHANIRLTPATFTLQVAHVTIPWPSYLYTFASNPNFGAGALAGANFDQPEGFFGSDRNLVSGHLRYTSGLGFGTAIDDHLLWGDRAYVVAGLGPLLNPLDTFSLVAYQRMGSHLTQSLNFSALKNFGAQSTYTLTDGLPNILYTLSATGYDGGHTFGSFATTDLTASTYDAPLVLRFKYHLSGDYGFAESTSSVYGLTSFPGVEPTQYTAMWHRSVGTFLTSPLYVTPFDTRLLVNGTATRAWYAYPRHDDVLTANASLSKFINRFVNVIGTYSASWDYITFTNSTAVQKAYFTPIVPIITNDGTPYPGYFAYLGAQDFRQYELDTNWTPSAALSLRVSFIRSDNFLQFHGFGTPPYQANFNMQVRPAGTLTLNLGRAYYFNWGRQAWQPQFVFSLSP
jgi:hypothetical protein